MTSTSLARSVHTDLRYRGQLTKFSREKIEEFREQAKAELANLHSAYGLTPPEKILERMKDLHYRMVAVTERGKDETMEDVLAELTARNESMVGPGFSTALEILSRSVCSPTQQTARPRKEEGLFSSLEEQPKKRKAAAPPDEEAEPPPAVENGNGLLEAGGGKRIRRKAVTVPACEGGYYLATSPTIYFRAKNWGSRIQPDEKETIRKETETLMQPVVCLWCCQNINDAGNCECRCVTCKKSRGACYQRHLAKKEGACRGFFVSEEMAKTFVSSRISFFRTSIRKHLMSSQISEEQRRHIFHVQLKSFHNGVLTKHRRTLTEVTYVLVCFLCNNIFPRKEGTCGLCGPCRVDKTIKPYLTLLMK